MDYYAPTTQKEKVHEAKLQERRRERAMETQRLTKLKVGLQVKLAADKVKKGTFQAA